MPVINEKIKPGHPLRVAGPARISVHKCTEKSSDELLPLRSLRNSLRSVVYGNCNIISEPMVPAVPKINYCQLVSMQQEVMMMQIAMDQPVLIVRGGELLELFMILLPSLCQEGIA
ncbi:hypothetical protein D3C75_1146460 [compost metagenome]